MSTPTFTVIQRPNAIFDETDKTKEMFSKWILNALRHPHGFNPRLNDVITFEVDFTEKTEPEAKIRTFILEGTSVHCPSPPSVILLCLVVPACRQAGLQRRQVFLIK